MTIGLDRTKRNVRYITKSGGVKLTGYYHTLVNGYSWQAMDDEKTISWINCKLEPSVINYQVSI